MAITVNSVKCPECGAKLPIEEGRTQLFCSYCGTKVIITNENEYIYHHVDEAEIKQAETDRMVELKRLEMAEKKREEKQKVRKLKIKISIILGLIMFICIVITASFGGNNERATAGAVIMAVLCFIALPYIWISELNGDNDDDYYDGKIKVPSGIDGYQKKHCAAIEAALKSAGFTNVQCVPLNDLTFGLIKKPGLVESITINGKEITSSGKRFPPDARIVITYHSIG